MSLPSISLINQAPFFCSLQEICLHSKLIAGPNISIADFLSRAPEAPAYLVLRNAVTFLKVIMESCLMYSNKD